MDIIFALLGTIIGGGFVAYAVTNFSDVEGNKKVAVIGVGVFGALSGFAVVGLLHSIMSGANATGNIIFLVISVLITTGCILYIKKSKK